MAAKSKASEASMLKVKQVRSVIGHTAATRGTVRALGLHRINQTVQIADTPENRGMLRRVAFLLEVEEPEGRAKAASASEGETK